MASDIQKHNNSPTPEWQPQPFPFADPEHPVLTIETQLWNGGPKPQGEVQQKSQINLDELHRARDLLMAPEPSWANWISDLPPDHPVKPVQRLNTAEPWPLTHQDTDVLPGVWLNGSWSPINSISVSAIHHSTLSPRPHFFHLRLWLSGHISWLSDAIAAFALRLLPECTT